MKEILNAHLTELVNNVENGDTSPLEAWFEMKQIMDKAKWAMGLVEDHYGQEIEPAEMSFGKSYLKASVIR